MSPTDFILVAVLLAAVAALALLPRTLRKRRAALRARRVVLPSDAAEAVPEAAKASPELVAAWVQFIRDEVANAANAINNRLAVIRATAAKLDRTALSVDQLRALDQIETEVARASSLTTGLYHHVLSSAPTSAMGVVEAIEERTVRPGVILVVDDDDANRDVISRLLTSLGHRTIPARDGLEAYTALQMGGIDCVISDIQMPGLGGKGLYEQVGETMPLLARQFVFVTGDYTRPETRTFLEQTGCPVVTKPYDLEALVGAVQIVLERAQVLRPTDDDRPAPAQGPA